MYFQKLSKSTFVITFLTLVTASLYLGKSHSRKVENFPLLSCTPLSIQPKVDWLVLKSRNISIWAHCSWNSVTIFVVSTSIEVACFTLTPLTHFVNGLIFINVAFFSWRQQSSNEKILTRIWEQAKIAMNANSGGSLFWRVLTNVNSDYNWGCTWCPRPCQNTHELIILR